MGKARVINVLSFINAPYECDLGDIHDHAEAANNADHVKVINIGDMEVSVAYDGPEDATDEEIIKSNVSLSEFASDSDDEDDSEDSDEEE